MKKYYYMVLVALFSLALNAFAQEDKWETVTAPGDTEAQTEPYNMVITLPDGTTFTVNTDEVSEVQFSNGKVTLSGTSIQQLLEYCEKVRAEQDKMLSTIHALVDDESILHIISEENKRAIRELNDYVTDLANRLDTLKVSGDAQDVYAEINKLNTDLLMVQAALQVYINNFTDKVLQHDMEFNNMNSELANLQSHDTAQDGQIIANTADIASIKSLLTTLNGQVADLNSQASKYISRDEFDAAIAALQSQLGNQGNNGSSLNGHAYVEIGGLKWATMNVGATTVAGSYATCYGDYYAWGETQPRYASITRSGTNSASFTWRSGYSSGYSSDNWPTYTGTTLDASHDAATANWGGTWRTPKREDFMALAQACSGSSSDQTPVNLTGTITAGGIYWLSSTQTIEPAYTGVAGLLFVSKSDISKRVFFPASGYVIDTSLYIGGTDGGYWSSSLYTSDTYYAYSLYFRSSNVRPSNSGSRYSGRTVRPVSD